MARHCAKEKLFVPGNTRGCGFKLTLDDIKNMTNVLDQINEQNSTGTCKLKGLHSIQGCEQSLSKVAPGAVCELMQTVPLDKTPDHTNNVNSDNKIKNNDAEGKTTATETVIDTNNKDAIK